MNKETEKAKGQDKRSLGQSAVDGLVMAAPPLNPEDCKRLEDSEEKLLSCPFCGSKAQLWQYEVEGNYLKGACCSNEDCPMDNPGRSFERPTIREAIALWNMRP